MRRIKSLRKRLFFIPFIKFSKNKESRQQIPTKILGTEHSDRRVTKRKKEIKLRKNFLPTLLAIVLLWSGVVFVVYFMDPATFGVIPLFLFLLYLSLLFTFATIFANTRRGLIISLLTILFLILRYLGVGNVLNLLLILGLGIAVEVYFSKK
jgi:hypothetical protein